MADVTIIDLDLATAPLAGTEVIPVVQGGPTVQTTAQDVADLAFNNIGALASAAPLDGTEEVGLNQSSLGVKVTTQDIADLAILKVPTITTVPALPSYVPITYATNNIITLNNVLYKAEYYSLLFSNLFTNGSGGAYFTTNPLQSVTFTGDALSAVNIYGSNTQFGAAYTSVSFPTVKYLSSGNYWESIQIQNTTYITTLNFPALQFMSSMYFSSNSALNTLNFPELLYMDSGITFQTNSLVAGTSISFPKLIQTAGSSIQITGIQSNSISFPQLVFIGYNLNINVTVDGATPQTLNLNSLQTIRNGTNLIQMPNLTSLQLPALKSLPASSTFTITAQLDETSVDSILASLVALDGTNGTKLYNNGTFNMQYPNTSPSTAGRVSVDTLRARGVTVNVYNY